MKLIYVSDIHIRDERDPFYHRLLKLIQEKIESQDVLILGGDIFDLFIEKKEIFLNRYSEFLNLIKAKSDAGTKIYYIEGNHDFHLSSVFSHYKNVKIIQTEIELTLSGKKFYLAHGDLVDTDDHRYLFLRGLLRFPLVHLAGKLMTSAMMEKIGKSMGEESQKRNPRMLSSETGSLEKVRKVFRNFAVLKFKEGFDFVLLGHCHDLDEMVCNLEEHQKHYMNNGYPRVHGKYILWNEGSNELSREEF